MTAITSGPAIYQVRQLNGHVLEVMGEHERDFYVGQQRRYLDENRYTAASDLADLDRLLFLELLDFRWRSWLARGSDYDGPLSPSAEEQLRKNLKENSPLISQIKNDLTLTKNQRDKEQAESVGAYINELKKRAKEHGVRRERQLTRALALVNELFSLVGTYQRSNQLERSKIGLERPEDILDWITNHMRPQYDEIDNYFRTHSQRYWLGRL